MKSLKNLISMLLLITSWIVMFQLITMLTKWTFAPWDMIDSMYMPSSVTTWELTLNSFFEIGIGKYIFSVPIVALSMSVWWRRKQQNRSNTIILTISNLLLLFGLMEPAGFIARSLNNILFPTLTTLGERYIEYIGYHRTIIPLITWTIVFLLWTKLQISLQQDKRKSKNLNEIGNLKNKAKPLKNDLTLDESEIQYEAIEAYRHLQQSG